MSSASIPELEKEVVGIPVAIGRSPDGLNHVVGSLQWTVGDREADTRDDAIHSGTNHFVECPEHRYLREIASREPQPLLEIVLHMNIFPSPSKAQENVFIPK